MGAIFVVPRRRLIGPNLRPCFDPAGPSLPALSRGGERVFRTPSLDGRGKGEGDKYLK
jgi:hypothetical protein